MRFEPVSNVNDTAFLADNDDCGSEAPKFSGVQLYGLISIQIKVPYLSQIMYVMFGFGGYLST